MKIHELQENYNMSTEEIEDLMYEDEKKRKELLKSILKSAKAIYKFRDNADTVGNEANSIIKNLED
jgi:hypothetical protein